ncbi:hypothetical protein [Fibrella aestuarina]|nr:hypothetical protein [Fibrella aestuarina]
MAPTPETPRRFLPTVAYSVPVIPIRYLFVPGPNRLRQLRFGPVDY